LSRLPVLAEIELAAIAHNLREARLDIRIPAVCKNLWNRSRRRLFIRTNQPKRRIRSYDVHFFK
jgi:hypothetical protein